MAIYREWRDAEAYDFTSKLDLLGWAWEFLRRNEEYQRDWLIELRAYFESPRVFGGDSPAFGDKWKIFCLPNGQTLCIGHPEFYFHAKQIYLDKYGIDRFVNPNQDRPRHYPFSEHHYFEGKSIFGDVWRDPDAAYEKIGNRYRPVAIDLALPLDRQLSKLLPVLKSEKERFLKEQQDKRNELLAKIEAALNAQDFLKGLTTQKRFKSLTDPNEVQAKLDDALMARKTREVLKDLKNLKALKYLEDKGDLKGLTDPGELLAKIMEVMKAHKIKDDMTALKSLRILADRRREKEKFPFLKDQLHAIADLSCLKAELKAFDKKRETFRLFPHDESENYWPLYLRLIDAKRTEKISFKEIAKEIYPNQKIGADERVKQNYYQAEDAVKHEFKRIAVAGLANLPKKVNLTQKTRKKKSTKNKSVKKY